MAEYNDNSCVANLGNTGLSDCLDGLGYDARLWWTPSTYEIADVATALLEATYDTGINAKNIYPFPLFDSVDDASEEDVEEELPTGTSIYVREGKYAGIGHLRTALCNLPNLRTFNEVAGRAFIVTSNGKIWGTSPDGVKFKGFKLSKFHVSKLGQTDGSTSRKIQVRYQFAQPSEMGDFPAVPNITTWDPLNKDGIINVVVTVDSSAAGSVVLSLARTCDGEAVDGLVEADFTFLASDGTTEMLPADVFADNGDGTYTFTFTTPVLPADTYTANLKTAALQTTGGYESTAAASFTIT
jgi:hypothetical protein